MVPLSVTLTIGSSTWHWISHLRRMNTTSHSCTLSKIMRGLFSPLFKTYKGELMRFCETRPCRNRSMQLTQMNMPLQWLGVEWTIPKTSPAPCFLYIHENNIPVWLSLPLIHCYAHLHLKKKKKKDYLKTQIFPLMRRGVFSLKVK